MTMAVELTVPTAREGRLSAALRRRVVAEIERRDLSEVANLLGMNLPTLRALLRGEGWKLELAYRMADRLDIPQLDELEDLLSQAS
jgi:transposase-like protein